ncbi:alpha/beta fold hydrolase [Puerhibacterium puerhi]|uniref:alpha/beta fold hydrolase n=1 Tax=Puerhibacterium puerhi TaxID=2692623 RepID=UPI001F344FFA|nr:alpha/beta fold hydrolase [Puerhibacterium puerhi]
MPTPSPADAAAPDAAPVAAPDAAPDAAPARLPRRAPRPDLADVVLRGARTRVHAYGPQDAPTTLVALHGFRGDHHGLEPIVADLLAAADVRLLVPDLPGFGASAPLPDDRHDVAGYAAWAAELLDAVAPDEGQGDGQGDVVLLGHSFGSVVAAATAARRAVRGLVLVNPIAATALAGRPGAAAVTGAFHRLAGALPERPGTALLRLPVVTRLASVAMVRTRDRALRRWIHAEHDRRFAGFADRRTLLEAYAASSGSDVRPHAPAVTAPTLLVAAELDDLAPVAAQRALAGLFADARLVVVPGTGHLAHYETPDAVAAAVADFLRTLDGRAR